MVLTRLEKARRGFVFTTDVVVALLTVSLLARLAWVTVGYSSSGPAALAAVAAVAAGVCEIAVCLLFFRVVRAAMRDAPMPVWELVVAAVLAAGALAAAPRGDAGGAALVWTGMVAAYCSLRVVVVCGVAMTAVTVGYVVAVVPGVSLLANVLYVAIQVAACCALMRVWLFLWRVLKEAYRNQDAKALLAVSEERLRFARDLHDLLGHSLSVISVKSELAERLLDGRPERARAEMVEVRRLAKHSLREVRQAVQGYRALDLGAELGSVRSVLEAAGVRCEVAGDGSDLPEGARTLLAWTIREGTTNVLKHSAATFCRISIAAGVLEMRNDGVAATADGAGVDRGGGSGLDGLSERVAAAGGTVSTVRQPGEFLLRAEVPT